MSDGRARKEPEKNGERANEQEEGKEMTRAT